ncbi:VWA domain-containing protein [Moritella sp. 5]|uniref:vWA domain-containing protein n=1 Tax=Moritella sp. 5 TaxID=2746231 RepID=UPI001BA7E4EE|nr:VWA domain-containing protein [Moritella sp. 5]QUM81960.1 VWA domain-containing protein [Moritella sp. 5]
MKSGKRQQGHAALLFTIIVPALFGLFILATDGVRALQNKARLGDAAEMAILTIAAANVDNIDSYRPVAGAEVMEGSGSEVNRNLVNNIISNYFDHQQLTVEDALKIRKLTCEEIPECREELQHGGHHFYEYRVEAKVQSKTWFSGNSSSVGFGDSVTVGHGAKARKSINRALDVVFVADFSGSMNDYWKGGKSKIEALKSVVGRFVTEIEKFEKMTGEYNTVGIVPYHIATADGPEKLVINFTNNADATISQIWQKGYVWRPRKADDPLCYDIPLTHHYESLIKTFNTFEPGYGTSSWEGIIRGAQILKKGNNARRLLIVLSDGLDGRKDIHKSLNDKGYCQIIKKGLSEGQNEKGENYSAKLAVIGYGYDNKVEDNKGLLRCVGADNVYEAEDEKEILDKVLMLMSEEVGHLK